MDDVFARIATVQTNVLIGMALLTVVGGVLGILGRGWWVFAGGAFALLFGWGLFTYPVYFFPACLVLVALGWGGPASLSRLPRARRWFRSRLPANDR